MRTIDWKPEAWEMLQEQFDYVWNHFGARVAEDFLIRLEIQTELLARNPRLGVRHEGEDTLRRSLYRKHFWIYYQFDDAVLEILTLLPAKSNNRFQQYQSE